MKRWKLCLLTLVCLIILSCNPDSVEMEIYTSDIHDATIQVVEIPTIFTFSTFSSNKDDDMDKILEIVKTYLGSGTEIKTAKGDYGDTITLKCKVPMGTKEKIETYVQNKK